MRRNGRLIIAIAASVTASAIALAGIALAQPAHKHKVAAAASGSTDYGSTPAYLLVDQHDRPFSSTRLTGQVQVISYLFPYCTSYCPLIARNLALTEQLADQHGLRGKVSFVAFNVDPGGASPRVLAAFLHQEGIDPNDPAWHFLTGTPAQISHVVRDGFHVYYQKVTLAAEQKAEAQQKKAGTYTPQPDVANAIARRAHVDYDIVHNDTIEITDRSGVIRTFIDSGDQASPQQLYHAISQALHR